MGATMGAARGGYGAHGLGERHPGCGAADPRKVYGQSQLTGNRCDFHKKNRQLPRLTGRL
jgi:hypothetical protein